MSHTQGKPKTGWPPGLLQDDSRKLSEWFASRIDARWVVRKVCAELQSKLNKAEHDLFHANAKLRGEHERQTRVWTEIQSQLNHVSEYGCNYYPRGGFGE